MSIICINYHSNKINKSYTSLVTFDPNNQPAPRGLIAQDDVSTSSGSDHTKCK